MKQYSKAHIAYFKNDPDLKYSIDYQQGEYVCGFCNKRFTVSYYRKNNYGGKISSGMSHAASANFNRHIISCWYKTIYLKQIGKANQ